MIKTNNVIIFISMSRSGSHGISNFILDLYDGPKVRLHGNIYNTNREDQIWRNEEETIIRKGIMGEAPVSEEKPLIEEYKREDNIYLSLLKEEDTMIKNIDFYTDNLSKWNKLIGQYSNLKFVLSIRDPFNMLSSVFSHMHLKREFQDYARVEDANIILGEKLTLRREKWKNHAREFLGITNHLKNKVCIHYNKWIFDKDYKEEIANNLDVEFNKDLRNKLVGTSFGKKEINKITGLDLIERWKKNVDKSEYYIYAREFFKDEEILDLSNKIFGNIEGTEIFYDNNSEELQKKHLIQREKDIIVFTEKMKRRKERRKAKKERRKGKK